MNSKSSGKSKNCGVQIQENKKRDLFSDQTNLLTGPKLSWVYSLFGRGILNLWLYFMERLGYVVAAFEV